MSMDFMDSVDHYNQTGEISLKWTENVNGSASIVSNGRNGQGLALGGVGKTLTHEVGWVVGFAFYANNSGDYVGNSPIYTAMHVGEKVLARVDVESDGSISTYSGNGFKLLHNSGTNSPPFFILSKTWYYIEIKVIVAGSTPITAQVEVRINTQVVCGANTDTTGFNLTDLLLGSFYGHPTINFHRILDPGFVDGFMIIDDVGIASMNGKGSINNYFGDIHIGCLFPRADQSSMNWLPDSGMNLWDRVNEQFPDFDTSYIYDKAVIDGGGAGDAANFYWQPTSVTDITAVHYGVFVRKDAEGTRVIQQTTNGVANGPLIYPGDSYYYQFFCMDQNPTTGAPWLQADFNGSTFGVITVE